MSNVAPSPAPVLSARRINAGLMGKHDSSGVDWGGLLLPPDATKNKYLTVESPKTGWRLCQNLEGGVMKRVGWWIRRRWKIVILGLQPHQYIVLQTSVNRLVCGYCDGRLMVGSLGW